MLLNCAVGEDSWESLGQHGDPTWNQSWIFIWRTEVEAETPVLWPPDGKNWVIWKDPDAGKDWRWEEKGMIEDQMDDITDSVNMSLSKLLELVMDRRPGMLQSMKSQTVRHNWVTELNWRDVEYIMGNDTLDESQDRIKIARRNITSFR